jgi:putative transposase
MRPSKFTQDQIANAVRQVKAGTPAVQICRTLGITQTTLHRWRKKSDGATLSELHELRRLRDENQDLKQVVANLLFLVIAAKPNNWS